MEMKFDNISAYTIGGNVISRKFYERIGGIDL